MVMRACMQRDDIEVVAVNDPFIEPDYMVYQLKYDSVHGRFNGDVSTDGKCLIVNGKNITICSERDPANIKWSEYGANYCLECTVCSILYLISILIFCINFQR